MSGQNKSSNRFCGDCKLEFPTEKAFLDHEDECFTIGEDLINHPSHYNAGKIEVLEFIEDQNLNFARGNVIKYTSRAGKKKTAPELEDLEKARFYLNREIELLKAVQENRAPLRPNEMVKS